MVDRGSERLMVDSQRFSFNNIKYSSLAHHAWQWFVLVAWWLSRSLDAIGVAIIEELSSSRILLICLRCFYQPSFVLLFCKKSCPNHWANGNFYGEDGWMLTQSTKVPWTLVASTGLMHADARNNRNRCMYCRIVSRVSTGEIKKTLCDCCCRQFWLPVILPSALHPRQQFSAERKGPQEPTGPTNSMTLGPSSDSSEIPSGPSYLIQVSYFIPQTSLTTGTPKLDGAF